MVNFELMYTSFNQFGHVWTIFDKFEPIGTSSNYFRRTCKKLLRTENFDVGSKWHGEEGVGKRLLEHTGQVRKIKIASQSTKLFGFKGLIFNTRV